MIDGGMAVQLEHHGARLRNPLWTALCLITNPAAVRQVHPYFIRIVLFELSSTAFLRLLG